MKEKNEMKAVEYLLLEEDNVDINVFAQNLKEYFISYFIQNPDGDIEIPNYFIQTPEGSVINPEYKKYLANPFLHARVDKMVHAVIDIYQRSK